ncbi:MAG: hypothetical protein HY080_09515 [Gammaproteobacteria bacterium]|nr:hypothetical protein [Gammaproteobacteria bacterium]
MIRVTIRWIKLETLLLPILLLVAQSYSVQAVPSFARQTGMACAACHTMFPELTAFGRNFKLNGYTMAGTKQVEAAKSKDTGGLKINELPPLSAMLEIGYTQTKKTAGAVQNSSVQFPQQLSMFYAGEISPNMGSFVQMTYDQASDHFSWDNADLRYADHMELGGKPLTYGLTLNNSPTVQDLWNCTPVWGVPYATSGSAKTPANSTLLEGTLAHDVAGLGGYAMWNSRFYAELTLYRSAHLTQNQPDNTVNTTNTINGVAPYLRLAWERNTVDNSWMVGLLALHAELYPTGINTSTDKYTDLGVDTQYQGKLGSNPVSAHASYILEKRTLDHSDVGHAPKLNSLRVDGSYFWSSRLVGTLSHFSTNGDSNTTTWGPGLTQPDSDGWSAEVSYLPWQNTKLTAQYRTYGKFDGTSAGAGNNDTLYLLAWFMW